MAIHFCSAYTSVQLIYESNDNPLMEFQDMKRFAIALVLTAACGKSPHPGADPACSCPPVPPPSADAPATHMEAHFSPNGGCTDAIVALLSSAKKTVRIRAYKFTSVSISDALIAARGRGVDVQVILDKNNLTESASRIRPMTAGGITTFIDSKHAIMHDTDVVVDGEFLETGSFNFTTAAEEKNAENCLVIHSKDLSGLYEADWKVHQEHSVPAP